MAEIDIERKKMKVLPWLIGIIVVAAIIWGIIEVFDADAPEPEEMATSTQPTAITADEPAAITDTSAVGGIDVTDVMEAPSVWAGRELSGVFTVADPPTDGGFWIVGDRGGRLFVAVRGELPADRRQQLQRGATVGLSGTVQQPSGVDAESAAIGEAASSVARQQPVFLVVEPQNVTVSDR